ncbi:MerR family transcriptional regulator [Aeromicrobium sp.]|uniref:MerR family transcriptional regulator n=1 Tax=Aeromicrobium sp. TaxID=1871063 RepID=UPI004033812E
MSSVSTNGAGTNGAMTIGDFAALTHLSIRTLRHYHQAGVLEPAEVDLSSGYRRYTHEQIATARVIHRLRELDLPLPQVKTIMATDDPAQRSSIIAEHLQRLEAELARTRSAVTALHRLLQPDPDPVVELRTLPSRSVAAVRATVDHDDVLAWYDAAVAVLDAAVPPASRRGPLSGRYANALFAEGTGSVSLEYTVDHDARVNPLAGVEVLELPAVELAVVVHEGDHGTIDESYARLGSWVGEHALTIGDVVHETYLVGPRDTSEPSAWRTEIGWPVLRLSSLSTD